MEHLRATRKQPTLQLQEQPPIKRKSQRGLMLTPEARKRGGKSAALKAKRDSRGQFVKRKGAQAS